MLVPLLTAVNFQVAKTREMDHCVCVTPDIFLMRMENAQQVRRSWWYVNEHLNFSFISSAEEATGGILQKKSILENFAKFIGKHLSGSLV